MKGKRVLSLALAALMTLSLLVVPAAAVSFTDMTNHWAKDDVEYLATQGVVKGDQRHHLCSRPEDDRL